MERIIEMSKVKREGDVYSSSTFQFVKRKGSLKEAIFFSVFKCPPSHSVIINITVSFMYEHHVGIRIVYLR